MPGFKLTNGEFIMNIKLRFILLFIPILSISCNNAADKQWVPDILEQVNKGEIFLPNYSYAGYRWGEKQIPQNEGTVIDVTEFGVIVNDKKDDTKALKAAFAAAHKTPGPVVVKLPAGRVILEDILYIERSNFTLTGTTKNGINKTILYMPKALNELKTPKYFTELEEYLLKNDKRQREKERGVDEAFSLYSWSGGFIWINYPDERGKPYLENYNPGKVKLAEIVSGKRGGFEIEVKNSINLNVGDIVRINWYNVEGEESSLIDYLYDYQKVKIGERHWDSPQTALTKQEVNILKIDNNTITIKEPLLHDLRKEWLPDITKWNHIEEVGIENINFEFLYQEYNYHHVEYGFNGIYFTNAAHSWARNLSFRNGDNGILSDMCSNITFDNISVYGRKYHYGVHFGDCYNMLAQNIYLQAPIVHSLTFNTGSRCCVYSDCKVFRDPTLDQHSGLNYQNLFDNIEIFIDDPAHNPLTMGGAKYWSPSHAAFSTFWNVKINYSFKHSPKDTIKIKGVTDSPSARLIGIYANYPIEIDYPINTYKEGINESNIKIPSLYKYQLDSRLSKADE